MGRPKDVDTGFGLDEPSFPIVQALDRHGVINPTMYPSELAVLKPWLAQWTVKPRFAFGDTSPANLLTFARALHVVSCLLFAYRVEAQARLRTFSDENYIVQNDRETARLAAEVEYIISEPEYATFVDDVVTWLGWPRENVATYIAEHRHEDNGQLFTSFNEEAWDNSAYAEYLDYCDRTGEKPVERSRWFALRAQAQSERTMPMIPAVPPSAEAGSEPSSTPTKTRRRPRSATAGR